MLVPKATPNLDDLLETREHKVGLAGQRSYMKPVSEADSVSEPPNDLFGRRIRTSDAPHVLRPPF
jgi:hypothetical protein